MLKLTLDGYYEVVVLAEGDFSFVAAFERDQKMTFSKYHDAYAPSSSLDWAYIN